MRIICWFCKLLVIAFGCLLQNCIHEYPVAVPNSGKGEEPNKIQGYIELSYDLSWEKLIHSVAFSSKASSQSSHRFIVEILKDEDIITHQVEYVDDEEFATGKFRRKLPVTLDADQYKIAAWYDRVAEDGTTYFSADDLRKISISNKSTVDTLAFHCAFSSDILDLREYADENKTVSLVKELEMKLPGARFQIVSTDVQDFITQQKEALNQGDRFTVSLNMKESAYDGFNAYDCSPFYTGQEYELSGRMRLPFAEYDEITIAQGFVFSHPEEKELHMVLSVNNSSLVLVSKTDAFYIPVKRGFITVVKGDFLIHPIDGIFSINNIWAGEIFYEI